MSRRTWTLLTSVVLVVLFGLLGAFVPVPYVALGPGPTHDTLGSYQGRQVVRIEGTKTFPTSGHLNMTTVSVTDQLSIFSALTLWASGDHALAPRELYFPPDKTEQQVERTNTRAFRSSQDSAETAALRHLGYPTELVAEEVVSDGPAEGVLQPGDELISAEGERLSDPRSLIDALSDTRPGQRVTLRFRREDREPQQATVRLAEAPDDRSQGFLGVQPALRPRVDFDVDIRLPNVGGPSAGLMFSLAVVDKLTPGELTDGEFVAGTGEIDSRGEVGRIGGIGFKIAKAHEAGARIFLVPEENCAAAKSQAPEEMRLIRVGTLDEAVNALEALRAGEQPPRC
ncbi:PDZ domain-containing protein [Actinopolyspora erythraea]|uniref:endopeptidase La n=1 Tax=Actinopolyspora erythraea TaxID=414996 RepID=A0A223RV21_9ACTN|nr:PDZ domain-containing protein [Actinopolyspora erythraea]ASU79720.1 PDZ domain-containing protein [Actinopolyspora erythraea]